jgi:hypothetical protein
MLTPHSGGEPKDEAMTKSPDAIHEAIHNNKHPFPPVANRPKKPQKHRYERRKVRQFLHNGHWQELTE